MALFEITKTYTRLYEAETIQEAIVADARKEIIWNEEDVTALNIVEVEQ